MSLNERIASLETAVRMGFERAECDRKEVKEALETHNAEMKRSIALINVRLAVYDEIINKGRGFQKALMLMWAGLVAFWGAVEGFMHMRKK